MTPGYAMKLAAQLGKEIRLEHGESTGVQAAGKVDTQGNAIPAKDDKFGQEQRDIIREHRALFGRQ